MVAILQDNAEDIISSYDFFNVQDVEHLLEETASMFSLIYINQGVDRYNLIANKIWQYNELISVILEECADDLKPPMYLNYLVQCVKECYSLSSNEEVLLLLKPHIQREFEEWGCQFINSVSEAIRLLEPIEDKLMLPEKWCSPKLYKSLGEFLKTFDCERCKVKKRVGYKNNGEFSNEQIIHIGEQLNGVSLSEKFDFYPTPEVLVNIVQELADIQDTDNVLEPSAGTGSLLRGLNKDNVTCVELNEVLATILKEKGYKVSNEAFEDFKGGKFDKIIMNPPFGKRLDAKHIIKAFNEHLEDGGTLVAIHSQGINHASDKASKTFRELVDIYGVSQENFNGEEFKNSGKGTTVATTITKLVKE